MLRIAAGPPQHLAKARVADAKALERVLAQRLAVLTLSARTEEALRAAMPRFAAVRALGKLLPAERKLSVLVARGDLPETEQALKLITSKDKALFNVQTLGKCQQGALQWVLCVLQQFPRPPPAAPHHVQRSTPSGCCAVTTDVFLTDWWCCHRESRGRFGSSMCAMDHQPRLVPLHAARGHA